MGHVQLAFRQEAGRLSRVNASAWAVSKRAVDIGVAVLALLILLPVLAVAVVLIKLESQGPVLFRQQRIGRGGRPFTMLKLRTMRDGASAELHRKYIAATGSQTAGTGLYKLTDDPRVTRVGGWLRRSSLDEVPQLLHVISGKMSIVGPRPAIDYEFERYEAHHFERFNVRPGLTGLWQVSGRARLGFTEMLELDVEYARNSRPLLDAVILARTPGALIRRDTS